MSTIPFVQSFTLFPSVPRRAKPPRLTSSLPTPRVLVTAPLPHAARLVPAFLSAHIRPICAPTVTTLVLHGLDVQPLRDALLTLHEYQVLLFESQLAITSVSTHLRHLCAGDEQAVALALRASGVRIAVAAHHSHAVKQALHLTPDIIPLDSSFAGFARFLGADHRLCGASVLLPVNACVPADSYTNDSLPALLHDAGLVVTQVPAYETRPVQRHSIAAELGMLSHVQALLFSSSAEVLAFNDILSDDERHHLSSRVRDGGLTVAVDGLDTATTAEQVFGAAPHVVADDHSDEELALVLAKRLSEGRLILPG